MANLENSKSPTGDEGNDVLSVNSVPQVVINEPEEPTITGETPTTPEEESEAQPEAIKTPESRTPTMNGVFHGFSDNFVYHDGIDGSQIPDDATSFADNEGIHITDAFPVPPDGGYGWVIVFAAFIANFLVDGISNAFGAFMGYFREEFKSSPAATSFIGSLLIGVYLLSGPLAGGLLNKYNARVVVIAGSVLAAASFALSTLAPNIVFFYLLYGLLGGMGFGFIYLPAIICVSMYFEKKRALATGLAVAGSGFGTFVLPYLCELSLHQFGWRITLYFVTGLIACCVVCGILFKPLPKPQPDSELQNKLNENMRNDRAFFEALSRAEEEQSPRPLSANSTELDSPTKRFSRTISVNTQGEEHKELLPENDVQRRLHGTDEEEIISEGGSQTPYRPPLSPISETKHINKSRAGSTHHGHNAPVTHNPRNRKPTMTSMGSEYTIDFKTSKPNLSGQLSHISARSYGQSLSRLSAAPMSLKGSESIASIAVSNVDPKEFIRPLSRQDIFLQGSIRNLREFREDGANYREYRESHTSIPAALLHSHGQMGSMAGDIADTSSRMGESRYSRMTGLNELEYIPIDDSAFKWVPLVIRASIAQMIDVELLKEPVMILMCIANVLGMLGFYIPFVYIIEVSVSRGTTRSEGTFLVSMLGIANTFGRVLFGWAADRHFVTALTLNNITLIFCGLLTCLVPFATNYTLLLVYATLFGFFVSAYICLTSVVLSDLLGIERLTNSFGLLIVARGIASLLGTPLAGMAYDVTNSYDSCFILSGILITLAGLASCAIPAVHRRQRGQMKNEGDFDFNAQELQENHSGKLSVLTERSEENLTEYQRTIQSLKQQKQLMNDLEEARRQVIKNNKIAEAHEDQEN